MLRDGDRAEAGVKRRTVAKLFQNPILLTIRDLF